MTVTPHSSPCHVMSFQRFLDKSVKAGQFLVSLQAYVTPSEAVTRSRRNYHESPPGTGGMFRGMKALLVMKDQRKREVYR